MLPESRARYERDKKAKTRDRALLNIYRLIRRNGWHTLTLAHQQAIIRDDRTLVKISADEVVDNPLKKRRGWNEDDEGDPELM